MQNGGTPPQNRPSPAQNWSESKISWIFQKPMSRNKFAYVVSWAKHVPAFLKSHNGVANSCFWFCSHTRKTRKRGRKIKKNLFTFEKKPPPPHNFFHFHHSFRDDRLTFFFDTNDFPEITADGRVNSGTRDGKWRSRRWWRSGIWAQNC